ncbi:MAG: hypothetical protein ABIE47_04445 [Pseudomonadota bacterium]
MKDAEIYIIMYLHSCVQEFNPISLGPPNLTISWKPTKIMNQITANILKKVAKTHFVRTAMEEHADLSAFRQRPTVRIIVGISAIGVSYIIGWPAVGLLGAISIHLGEPLIVAIGGPMTYGLSHLVFIVGMYLAGAEYARIFLRWATRVAMERLIGHTGS